MTSQATMLLRLAADEGACWRLGGRNGEGELAAAAEAGGEARLTVLVPGAEVLTTHARLPAGSRQRLRKALPYALEEQLATEVEAQHFAMGETAEGGEWPVAVVAHTRMTAWQAALDEAGLHPRHLLPDYLALPLREGRWSLWLEGDDILLRCGPACGYHLSAAGLAEELELAVAAAPEPPQAIDLYTPAEQLPEGLPATIEYTLHSCDDPLRLFEQALAEPPVLDLLQGEFSRREQAGRLWRPWRAAAILAGLWLLLQGGMAWQQLSSLSAEEQQLSASIEALYQQTLPGRRLVLGQERALMENALNELRRGGGQGGFAALLAQAAPLIPREGAELQGLRYKEGALELQLQLRDLPQLDQMKADLRDAGLRMEVLSATAREQGVESRIEIRGGGA